MVKGGQEKCQESFLIKHSFVVLFFFFFLFAGYRKAGKYRRQEPGQLNGVKK